MERLKKPVTFLIAFFMLFSLISNSNSRKRNFILTLIVPSPFLSLFVLFGLQYIYKDFESLAFERGRFVGRLYIRHYIYVLSLNLYIIILIHIFQLLFNKKQFI